VVLTILKNISQWEGLSHILWKIKMFETTNQLYIQLSSKGPFLWVTYPMSDHSHPTLGVRSSKYPTSRDILTSQKVTMTDSHFQPAQNHKSLGIVIPRRAKDQTWIYFGIPFANLKIALENYQFHIVWWFIFQKCLCSTAIYFMSILTSVAAGRRHHAVSTVSRFPTNISQKLLIAPSAMFVGL